jgi:hypothetical protein
MTDEHEDVDDQAARDARVVEFIRLVEGYAFDFDDMGVLPATATSKAMISIAGRSAPADRLYRIVEERAADFGMTAKEFLEVGLGAEKLLNELNDPPDERGNAT